MTTKQKAPINVDLDQLRRIGKDFSHTGRRIWLAGLGAVARAEEGSRELFDTLVERGKKIEVQQFKTLDKTVATASKRVGELGDRLQNGVEDGLREVFARFGLPTRSDLENLSARVEALTEKLDQAVER